VKPNKKAEKLEFPIPSGLEGPERPQSQELALELSWRYLPKLMRRPGFWEDRLKEPLLPEFDLVNPGKLPATYPADLLDLILPKS
jgi:hypothetical protein